MCEDYGLREVWLPENITDSPRPQCNVFMSEEFAKPDPEVNMKKRALVLI